MRGLMIRHRVSDETGAVVPIVVLSLIALFGMVVLTVDVGGLMVKRRNMVNAADAAALAAAQSYANDDAICGSTDDIAHAQATALAGDNVSPTISETQYTPNCTAQSVKVGYESPADLFFAPVLGFGNSTMVRSTATAIWGTLAGGNAVPIVLESGTLQGSCDVPNEQKGTTCAFWYNNKDPMGNAAWGFMNLDLWNVGAGDHCSNAGASSRSDWIANGYPDPRVLNGDPPGSLPTYVCNDTGHTASDWKDLYDQIGKVKLFPVNDCQGQLDKSGNVSPCPSTPDKYDIIGFTGLKIQAVYKGNDPLAIGTPGGSGTCSKNIPTLNYLQQVNLNVLGTPSCFSAAPDHLPLAGVQVLPKTGPPYVGCAPANPLPGNCDFAYDESTRVLQWVKPSVSQVTITFDWSNDNVGGACPGHSSDPNAICLVTVWDGFKVFSGPVGQGPDLGARGVRLLE